MTRRDGPAAPAADRAGDQPGEPAGQATIPAGARPEGSPTNGAGRATAVGPDVSLHAPGCVAGSVAGRVAGSVAGSVADGVAPGEAAARPAQAHKAWDKARDQAREEAREQIQDQAQEQVQERAPGRADGPDSPCPGPPLPWRDARMFYLAPDQWPEREDGPHVLQGQEAQHAIKVLRLKPGDPVRVLDGAGREGAFTIARLDRREVVLRPERIWRHPRPQSGAILAAGWTKAARRGWILEKAVEFEAEAIWLWQAERSQFPVPGDLGDSWRGQLVAGAKQCRNPWLPELRTLPGGVDELIRMADGAACARRFALLESDHGPSLPLTPDRLGNGRTIYVVGPEGGFTPREADALLAAGFSGATLGDRVLRWETAALLCLGLHWWKKELERNR